MNSDSYMRFVFQANENINMMLQFYQETNDIMRNQLNQTQSITNNSNTNNINTNNRTNNRLIIIGITVLILLKYINK